jgi:hypothetical protein
MKKGEKKHQGKLSPVSIVNHYAPTLLLTALQPVM